MTHPPRHQPPPPRKRRTGLVVAAVVGGLLLALVAVGVIWRVVSPPERVRPRDYQDLELRVTNAGMVLASAEGSARRLSTLIEQPLQQDGLDALERQTRDLPAAFAGVEQSPAFTGDAVVREKVAATTAATSAYADVLTRYRTAYPAVQNMAHTCAQFRRQTGGVRGDLAQWMGQAAPCRRAIDAARSAPMQQPLVEGYRSWLDLATEGRRHSEEYARSRQPAAQARARDAERRSEAARSQAVAKNAEETGGALDDSAAAARRALGDLGDHVRAKG